jgi:DNA-binding protein YbaB
MPADNPMSDPTGSVERLRREVEALMDGYDVATRRIADAQRQMREVAGKAESSDRTVKVTVGPQGKLTGLELDQRAYRKLAPAKLAALILELTEQAAADVTEQMKKLLGPLLPAGLPVERLLSGEAGPEEINPILSPNPEAVEEWWAAVSRRPDSAA